MALRSSTKFDLCSVSLYAKQSKKYRGRRSCDCVIGGVSRNAPGWKFIGILYNEMNIVAHQIHVLLCIKIVANTLSRAKSANPWASHCGKLTKTRAGLYHKNPALDFRIGL